MTCAELKELAAAYALGALEPDERAAVEAHLEGPGPHDGCREALAEAHTAASALARALPPVRPDERVWKAIASQLDVRVPANPALGRRLPSWTPWMVAAAAALAALYLGVDRARLSRVHATSAQELVALRTELGATNAEVGRARAATAQERERCERAITELRGDRVLERQVAALLEQPGTQVVALGPANARRLGATAIVNVAQRRGFVLATALPVAAGKDYELWVLRGKAPPLPAGLMHDLGNGMMLGELSSALLASQPDAVAISLEPAGGRPAPTEVVSVGKLAG